MPIGERGERREERGEGKYLLFGNRSREQNTSEFVSFPSLSSLLSPLFLNAVLLLLAAIWLRCHMLENIPGINGDEAWYGVQAWRIGHGGPHVAWHTPTGNPLNPLFIGPLALLHLWLPPSIMLLRSLAVASGLFALVLNWLFCRWVFDRRTAIISTVLLAVLPINIAYCRIAWDASQSLAATLPVVYFALAAALSEAFWSLDIRRRAGTGRRRVGTPHEHLRRRGDRGRLRRALEDDKENDEAQMTKHENDEARMTKDEKTKGLFVIRHSSFVILILAGSILAAWILAAGAVGEPLASRIGRRLGSPGDFASGAILYPRLFTGAAAYRYLAGARSWFEWPTQLEGCGADIWLFWAGTLRIRVVALAV